MKLFPPRIGLVRLSILAVIVGIMTGFGAIVFRDLIGLIHNVAFLGGFSFVYNANRLHPAEPLGPVHHPGAGRRRPVVTFLVRNFAPEARGHGVPEVMDAIYYRDGKIRPVVAAVKSLASALAIGTGSSVGREGPIIQIGASLGSTLGQIMRMAAWQRITLVAAGAGAGIAATFNTPIGGVMFAIELMMPESERAHLSAGGARDRHRDLHRPVVPRRAAGLRRAGAAARLATRPARSRRCCFMRCSAP